MQLNSTTSKHLFLDKCLIHVLSCVSAVVRNNDLQKSYLYTCCTILSQTICSRAPYIRTQWWSTTDERVQTSTVSVLMSPVSSPRSSLSTAQPDWFFALKKKIKIEPWNFYNHIYSYCVRVFHMYPFSALFSRISKLWRMIMILHIKIRHLFL